MTILQSKNIKNIFHLGILLSTAWSAPALAANHALLQSIFSTYLQSLTSAERDGGNCVSLATAFSRKAAPYTTVDDALRIVLLVGEPDTSHGVYMPQPLVPEAYYVYGEPVRMWAWHAFVLIDGVVFDPKFRPRPETDEECLIPTGEECLIAPLDEYYKKFWQSFVERAEFSHWIFTAKPGQEGEFTGSPYPGAAPRMTKFLPITFVDLIDNPQHLSERKPDRQ